MGEVIAVIHAKGMSERIPNKNMQPLGDKPLFCHAIENAKASGLMVVIDSDSDVILEVGKKWGATPLKRLPALTASSVTGDELIYWAAINYPNTDIIVQVMPTAPFLKPESIEKAVNFMLENEVDSITAVYQEPFYQWFDSKPAYLVEGVIPNSQDMPMLVYETTGLYAVRTKFALSAKKRINPMNCGLLFVSKLEAIDINTPEDLEFARIVWNGLKS